MRRIINTCRYLLVIIALSSAGRAYGEGGAQTSSTAVKTPGPQLELPDEPDETPAEGALARAISSALSGLGGYGELTLNVPDNAPGIVDLRRFVLFFGHTFNDWIHFFSEVEVEHAISSAEDEGEVEIEQAYLDALLDRHVKLRGGLILVPVGIINVFHEPPSFNGVDRPDVDTLIIPSTWREPGLGVFGEIAGGLRYQAYLVTGFNANGFTAESTIREGHQEAQLAHARDFGGVLRLDYEVVLGTHLGLSGYLATSGNTLEDAVGRVPVGIVELDARTTIGGFSARGEAAVLFIGDAGALNRTLTSTGTTEQREALPIASRAIGGYVEVAYDVLYPFLAGGEQSLDLFGRLDFVDTQSRVPDGFDARPALRRTTITVGATYRPIDQIALKLDYRRHFFGEGAGFNEGAAAITWLF